MKSAKPILAAIALGATIAPPAVAQPQATVAIATDRPGPQVNRQIFTQFAEHLGHGIYGGIWVGPGSKIPNVRGIRTDVVQALRAISVPVVRWPGGCFADEYHWREGVGPRAKRPVRVNTNWGGVTEDNGFGTHEFMDFVGMIGAEPYVSADVGSAPPREMAEWIEYITSPTGSSLAKERGANGHPAAWRLPYVGIGNELWGCGGNMRAEYAADVTRQYATFVKSPAGQRIMKFASGASDDDYQWTDTMMRVAGSQIDGITLHHYTVPGPWAHKGSATGFDEDGWAAILGKTIAMDDLIAKHSAIMDKYDPQKRVWLVVDEWGTWYDVEPGTNPGFLYQQNSLRDALVAAVNLNIFVKHADRVKMTAIAQMVNVLQAMILTDGPRMVLTPTYQVYKMYLPWQDATELPLDLKSPWYSHGGWTMPQVSASAVRGKDGHVHIALANLDPAHSIEVSANLAGASASRVAGTVLTASDMDAVNSFDKPDQVMPRPFDGARFEGGQLITTLPAKSVVVLDVQ